MKKEKKAPKTSAPDEGTKEVNTKDVKKDTAPAEEEQEYVGLPDRDLKKNLGCG